MFRKMLAEDRVFNSKHSIMIDIARGLRQTGILENINRAVEICENMYDFCIEIIGERKEETIVTLYEIAKTYVLLIKGTKDL